MQLFFLFPQNKTAHEEFIEINHIFWGVLTLLFIFQGWIDNMNGPSGLYIAVSILIIFIPPLNEVERGVYWNEIVRLSVCRHNPR